ncbi:protein kinase domain-containing protein [Pyxidicoccus sp. 3LG]
MKDELLAGRYQLEHELGRGGMATVFLARDLRLSRRVAVKVMHPGGDGRRAERFRREAELAASLKHPNVLEVHDFGEDATHGPFLVCEWVQGESLRELARRLAPVPPEVVAVLGWELARALEAAHARGVVHRDVKPENVLVSKGGPLKLADFGIAALEDQERLTSTGAITGSLAYMAPERLDTGAWSPASDVYAVGVILFELCTGTTPHAGRGSAHLAASVMTRDAPRLAEAAPGTPEPLSALVDRCLARDSRERPADGAELAAGLEAMVGRIAGPPAEVSRSFFAEPETRAARWREDWFQQLLSEGWALLSRGEGAQAARLLNTALVLRPGAPEVLALLRTRPRVRRAKKLLGASAVVVGALGLFAILGRVGTSAGPEHIPAAPAPAEPAPPLAHDATSSTTNTPRAPTSPATPGAPRPPQQPESPPRRLLPMWPRQPRHPGCTPRRSRMARPRPHLFPRSRQCRLRLRPRSLEVPRSPLRSIHAPSPNAPPAPFERSPWRESPPAPVERSPCRRNPPLLKLLLQSPPVRTRSPCHGSLPPLMLEPPPARARSPSRLPPARRSSSRRSPPR